MDEFCNNCIESLEAQFPEIAGLETRNKPIKALLYKEIVDIEGEDGVLIFTFMAGDTMRVWAGGGAGIHFEYAPREKG